MDFGLAEEYQAFRDVARRWVDAEVPKSWARALEKDEHNYPFALWDKLTEAGFNGVGVSEEYAGPGGVGIMQMMHALELGGSLCGRSLYWGGRKRAWRGTEVPVRVE